MIFGNVYNRIKGGWKTVGASGVDGAFASDADWIPTAVGPMSAMRLSAYFACCRLRSEIMGSMTFQLYDNANKLIADHDLYALMRAPNQFQTGDAFVSGMAANKITFGNSMALISRHSSNGSAYALDFYTSELWDVSHDTQGRPKFKMNGESVRNEDVLHWAGFGLSGYWGLPALLAGGEVMAMQVESNRSAARTFSNGLRAGGFFKLPENRQAFTNEQLSKFNTELAKFSLPQNTSKWLPLLPGMEPVANTNYRIDPVTAELLQSRYFGIEEICRYMGVPPPLIGHTDKASSWASSLDGLNQFLVTYTAMPDAIRLENQIGLKLLGRNERSRLKAKYNMDALLRGDIVKRYETYDIGIVRGVISPNEARALENLPKREGGDDYGTSTEPTPKQPKGPSK